MLFKMVVVLETMPTSKLVVEIDNQIDGRGRVNHAHVTYVT